MDLNQLHIRLIWPYWVQNEALKMLGFQIWVHIHFLTKGFEKQFQNLEGEKKANDNLAGCLFRFLWVSLFIDGIFLLITNPKRVSFNVLCILLQQHFAFAFIIYVTNICSYDCWLNIIIVQIWVEKWSSQFFYLKWTSSFVLCE